MLAHGVAASWITCAGGGVRRPAHLFRENMSEKERVNMKVFDKDRQRLFERKTGPGDTYADVVERLLDEHSRD